jgi:hypothetical protein
MPITESSVARTEPEADSLPTPPRPTLAQALLVLAAVVIGVGGYIALSTTLGIREAYVGFIFVFYWLSLEHGKARQLPAIVLGTCFGLATAWLLQYSLHSAHMNMLIPVFLATVAISIVCLVLGRLPYLINTPAMLMLTVFTIPHMQQAANFPRLYVALAFAAVYFGVFVGGLTRLAARLKS